MIGASFATALSEHPDPAQASGEIVGQVLEQVGSAPDLAVLFLTDHYVDALAAVVKLVGDALQPSRLLGATAVGVVGAGREVEDGPGMVLWAGAAGPTTAIRLEIAEDADGRRTMTELPGDTGPTLLLLADPYTFPVALFLDHLGGGAPRVIGGLASAAPGRNRLVLDDQIVETGAVGVALTSPPGPTVVSQGCGPIGSPFVVTDVEGNVVRQLAGQPAAQRLLQLLEPYEETERRQVAQRLHLGVVVDEGQLDFGRGDFLVRGLLGIDHLEGTLTVGEVLEVGQTVQFHRRDAPAASEDLHALLAGIDADAGLLFTCNGRGRRLFDVADHDARAVAAATRSGAVAGMFCAGEIGPVGGRSFVHGFTASTQFFTSSGGDDRGGGDPPAITGDEFGPL